MDPIPTYLPEQPTIEQGVNALMEDVKLRVRMTRENCEQHIRRSPGKAVLAAVAAGYCLHRLPVRSMLVAQVRLITALAPPALLAFGAAKLCEFLQNEARRR